MSTELNILSAQAMKKHSNKAETETDSSETVIVAD